MRVLWLWSLCPSRDPAPLDTIVFPTAMPGLQLGDVRSTPLDQGGLYQYLRVQGTFRHDWDMRRYPFDRHQLVIPVDEAIRIRTGEMGEEVLQAHEPSEIPA